MADIELKPCPFCGSKDIELRAGVVFNGATHCKNCSADVVFDAVRMIAEGDYDWKTAVTNGWNNRAEDVVPRSEYDAVVSAVDNSTKEFLKLHDAYQNQKREFEAELDKAKQEFAWEIFEKIEDLFFDKYLLGNITASLFEYKYAELKKKYIGE